MILEKDVRQFYESYMAVPGYLLSEHEHKIILVCKSWLSNFEQLQKLRADKNAGYAFNLKTIVTKEYVQTLLWELIEKYPIRSDFTKDICQSWLSQQEEIERIVGEKCHK